MDATIEFDSKKEVEKQELTEEEIKEAVNSSYVKGDCSKCGETQILRNRAGRNDHHNCENCDAEITVLYG